MSNLQLVSNNPIKHIDEVLSAIKDLSIEHQQIGYIFNSTIKYVRAARYLNE